MEQCPRTMKGFFLTPGLRRIPDRVAKECCSTCAGQMSTLVTTKNTATSTESSQDTRTCIKHQATEHHQHPSCTWHFEGQCDAQVLLAHAHNACTGHTEHAASRKECACGTCRGTESSLHPVTVVQRQPAGRRTGVGAYDEAGVVWQKASEPVCSGLEVALVARQVNQGDHLAGARDVVRAGVRAEHAVVQHLAMRVQLQTPAEAVSHMFPCKPGVMSLSSAYEG